MLLPHADGRDEKLDVVCNSSPLLSGTAVLGCCLLFNKLGMAARLAAMSDRQRHTQPTLNGQATYPLECLEFTTHPLQQMLDNCAHHIINFIGELKV